MASHSFNGAPHVRLVMNETRNLTHRPLSVIEKLSGGPLPVAELSGYRAEMNEARNLTHFPSSVIEKLSVGRMLSPDDVAEFSGYHVESIRRALRRGTLSGVRPRGQDSWRIPPASVADWLGIPLSELLRGLPVQVAS